MDIKDHPLCPCSGCESTLTFGDVASASKIPEGRLFSAYCEQCSTLTQCVVTRDEMRELKELYYQGREERERKVRANMIGRMVHGFRIDLDVIKSVDDLIGDWAYMDKYRPWEIPKEGRVYAPLGTLDRDKR